MCTSMFKNIKLMEYNIHLISSMPIQKWDQKLVQNFYKKVKENPKLISNKKRKVQMILHCGRQANQKNLNGLVHGVRVDLVGISNALSWRVLSWVILLICMLEELIYYFHIMTILWLKLKHVLIVISGLIILFILDIWTFKEVRCLSHLKIFWLLRKF